MRRACEIYLTDFSNGGSVVTIVPGTEPVPERSISVETYIVEPSGERLTELSGLIDDKVLTLRIADVVGLSAVAEAHRRLEEESLPGRLLIDPSQ